MSKQITLFKKYILNYNFVLLFILSLVSILTYINILPNQLFFDDEELIYKNKYVADLKLIPKYFTQNIVVGSSKMSNFYRPVLTTSFALDHLFWGNKSIGYHLTSIILHTANGILVYLLILILFKNYAISFLTSIIFLLHPVQTEAVSYASGRTDLLYSTFLLSSSLFIVKFKLNRSKLLFYVFSLILFILALLSKESAIITPFILILCLYFSNSKKLGSNILLIIPFLLLDFVYIFLRMTVLNFENTLNFYTISNVYSNNILIRFFTFTKVFFIYLKIILYPVDLIIARTTPIITTLTNPWIIFFFVLVILWFVYALKVFKKNKIFLFSFIWFFITILPVSGIVPINNIIAEHYLYLPSISFFLIMAFIINSIWNKLSKKAYKYLFILFIFIIFILLSIRTIIRNNDWRNPLFFYTISLKQSPWHIPMRNNLAMVYAQKGLTHLAIIEYKKALSYGDWYPNIHHNLANSYKSIYMYKEAEEEYNKALQIDPQFAFSYYGLADLYQIWGDKKKYEEIIKKIDKLSN